MNNKEMMELRPELDSQFDELVKYCMASGVIDSNLYIEYDVKRGLERATVRVFLRDSRRFPM